MKSWYDLVPLAAFAIVAAALGLLAAAACNGVLERERAERACAKRGGIPMFSRGGLVCVRKDAVVP